MNLIPVAGPWITQKEIDAVTDAAANAWYGNAGVWNDRFEQAFAAYVGRRRPRRPGDATRSRIASRRTGSTCRAR